VAPIHDRRWTGLPRNPGLQQSRDSIDFAAGGQFVQLVFNALDIKVRKIRLLVVDCALEAVDSTPESRWCILVNMNSVIGTDSASILVQGIREQLGEHPRWRELESVIYDTLREFETLPEAHILLRLPKKLSDSQKAEVSHSVSEAMKAYGRECRDALLAPLLEARIRLYLMEHE
jgi:ribosomal protein S24E